eukprot:TRINITY_DN11268_c0_g1_i1.p1 TRINITY_DN11268_c0_g1~~TRINITY_DN11268_c0_g1_i1.p1  ORF type:complete len:460 (+),score=79.03 TRINITY_DN11268_c0_g1_i1:125-1504(+)
MPPARKPRVLGASAYYLDVKGSDAAATTPGGAAALPSDASWTRFILLAPPTLIIACCGYFLLTSGKASPTYSQAAVAGPQVYITPDQPASPANSVPDRRPALSPLVNVQPQLAPQAKSDADRQPAPFLPPSTRPEAQAGLPAPPQAAATDPALAAGSQGACSRFVVQPIEGSRSVAGDAMQGSSGGEWNMCTHLKNYGLNTMPALQRFLVHQLQPASALEFGCGLGTTSDYVQRFAGANVTCIEPDAGLLTAIRRSEEEKAGKGAFTRLGVNIFSEAASQCFEQLQAPEKRVDLVYTFEVAEHVPVEFHERLVQLLSRATKKWLVFAAARPGQLGTGHLGPSMKTAEEWKTTFQKAGLIFMQQLTQLVRNTAYWHRSYDLYGNALVFRHPDFNAEDTNKLVPAVKEGMKYWAVGLGNGIKSSTENLKEAGQERDQIEMQLWPELKTMARAARQKQPPCN